MCSDRQRFPATGIQVSALHVLGSHRFSVPCAHRRPPESQAVRVFVLRVPFQLALGYHQAYPAQVGKEGCRRGDNCDMQLASGRQSADDGRDGSQKLQQVQPVPNRDGNGHIGRSGQGSRWRVRGRKRCPQVRGRRHHQETAGASLCTQQWGRAPAKAATGVFVVG